MLGQVAGLIPSISIHALLAESDLVTNLHRLMFLQFLSTLSLRRATLEKRPFQTFELHFYPRSPCGERPSERITTLTAELFLSTLSLRRATAKVHKTVGYFCAYETYFMEIASSC